jgi:hypothetical protein
VAGVAVLVAGLPLPLALLYVRVVLAAEHAELRVLVGPPEEDEPKRRDILGATAHDETVIPPAALVHAFADLAGAAPADRM